MNHDRHYYREENKNNNNNNNNNNTGGGGGGGGGCYFHPRQVLVGVCPLCLNERLVVLASKQAGRGRLPSSTAAAAASAKPPSFFHRNQNRRKHSSFPKIFALGSYFFNRLELRNWKSEDSDHDCASTSQDDSFISIKFEDNGAASWDKGKSTVSKVSLEHCNMTTWNHSLRKETPKRQVIEHLKETKESKSVIEHSKPRASLRWRKRIGHLFQLIRWKRSSKSNVCHVGSKVEGVKVRKGWIRTLTKRRTKDL